MPTRAFKTLPDELLGFADAVADDFQLRGFKVQVERAELGYPFTPALVCSREKITTIIVEVASGAGFRKLTKRLDEWVRYARSTSKDTRVAVCLPHNADLTHRQMAALQDKGVGLYVAFRSRVVEQIVPADLGLNVALPELESLSPRVRSLLGDAYEQFAHTHWREGFEDARKVLEAEGRRYLNHWSRTGRITVMRKKGPIRLTAKQINRMTIGDLASDFARIQNQNHADSVIAQALVRINKDRVNVVHKKKKKTTEKRLRSNVGQHMWTIVAALKHINL
jgi:hypothetical protein